MKDPCFPGSWAPVALSNVTSVFSGFLTIFITAGNLLIVMAIVKDPNKCLRSPFAYFLANLALSDLIVGLIAMPVSVLFHAFEAKRAIDTTKIYIVHTTFFISLSASLFSMVAMCVDRYYTVISLSRDTRKFTRNKCIAVSLVIWILSIAFTGFYFLFGYTTLVTIYLNISFLCIFGITLVTYVKIMRSMKDISAVINKNIRKKAIAKGNSNTAKSQTQEVATRNKSIESAQRSRLRNNRAAKRTDIITGGDGAASHYPIAERGNNPTMYRQNRVIARERRITSVFLTMLAAFLSSNLPSLIFTYILQFCLSCTCDIRHIFRDLIFILLPTGSGLNALICIIKLPYVRAAVKEIITCRTKNRYTFSSSENGENSRNRVPQQWYTHKKSNHYRPNLAERNAYDNTKNIDKEAQLTTRPASLKPESKNSHEAEINGLEVGSKSTPSRLPGGEASNQRRLGCLEQLNKQSRLMPGTWNMGSPIEAEDTKHCFESSKETVNINGKTGNTSDGSNLQHTLTEHEEKLAIKCCSRRLQEDENFVEYSNKEGTIIMKCVKSRNHMTENSRNDKKNINNIDSKVNYGYASE